MSPENPVGLVVLTLHFEGEELKADVEVIERTQEIRANNDRLYCSWNADKKPEGFFSAGGGAVFVRETTGTLKGAYSADLDSLGSSRYSWRYGSDEPIMAVLVLPDDYILTDMQPWPTRVKAFQSKRLAAYWMFRGGSLDFSFVIKKRPADQSLASIVERINSRGTMREADLPNVAVDSINRSKRITRGWETPAIFAFGVAFILLLIVIAIFFPTPTPFQYFIFRTVIALAAAGIAALIPGFLEIDSPVVRAGGALAVFVLVYQFSPASLVAQPPTVTYKVCSGEYEKNCLPHDMYQYCYFDVSKWAQANCSSFTTKRLDTRDGNKCGYTLDQIICTGPK